MGNPLQVFVGIPLISVSIECCKTYSMVKLFSSAICITCRKIITKLLNTDSGCISFVLVVLPSLSLPYILVSRYISVFLALAIFCRNILWEYSPGNILWEYSPGNILWEYSLGNILWEYSPGNILWAYVIIC